MFMEATANNYFTYKYPTGFALSGGFIKGFAHLGVMQALLEHDIRPDVLSGVSAGALAGVFYADGNEPHDVLRFFAGHTFQDLTKLVIPKVGLFELDEFIDFLRTNLKAKRLEQLKTPLIVTATDLDHGRLVHFHKGDIAERVAASCCMPVLFAPVCIDGTNYVDGGVLMNLPVSVISEEEEKKASGFFGMMFPLGHDTQEHQKAVFNAQADFIRKAAAKESCIIVGRCADYLLQDDPDAMHVYIYAPYADRLANCVGPLHMDKAVAKKMIAGVDKARDAYHRYFAGYPADDPDHNHFIINSALLEVEGTAQALAAITRVKFGGAG